MEATSSHVAFCFNILCNAIDSNKYPLIEYSFPEFNCPVFVTFKINDGLRGCIGTWESNPIRENLKNITIKSAFYDHRFPPIKENELSSLLVNFEEAADCFDWTVGKHGIKIYMASFSATFLPEVASDRQWDKETTLTYLLRKSGYFGNIDKDVYQKIKLIRYESIKKKMDFEEYLNYKN